MLLTCLHLHDSAQACHAQQLCVTMVMLGAKQVRIGSRLPNVQLILPSAADPEPESFVTTQDLFNGTCCFQTPPHAVSMHACRATIYGCHSEHSV